MPRVTVIVPAYNCEASIAEALASVQAQTFTDVEVVLVDDGSTDGTVAAAGRFLDLIELRILSQANAGPSAARNHGIRAARGRYCAFLDADDLMHPERIAAQTAHLDHDTAPALVHTDLMTFDENGIIHPTRHIFSDPCGGYVLDRLLMDNFITTSTVMARKDRLLEVGAFDERRRLSEDFDLWLRLAERWPVGFLDRPLTRYRRRHGSLSDDKFKTGLAALDVVENFWSTHGAYRHLNARLYRRSLSRHLCFVGAAALAQEGPWKAIGYLSKALLQDCRDRDAWKWLAKTALASVRQRRRPTSDTRLKPA